MRFCFKKKSKKTTFQSKNARASPVPNGKKNFGDVLSTQTSNQIMEIPLWFQKYSNFHFQNFLKIFNKKIENRKKHKGYQKNFFFPLGTGEALAFSLEKVIFLVVFFVFYKRCHSTCAFESFSSIFSFHLWKSVTTVVILKGFMLCFWPHIPRKWK